MGRELDAIRSWSPEVRIQRLRELLTSLVDCGSRSDNYVIYDQIIAIMLEMLRDVFADIGYKASPLDKFISIYSGMLGGPWKPILDRFEDTAELVQKYKNSDDEGRAKLRSELVTRGMITGD